MKIDKDIALEKKKIREKIRYLLNNLSDEDYKLKSSIITDKFLRCDEYKDAETIFIYYPFRKEINTRIIIKDALSKNKKIVLPKVSGSEIKLFFITDIKKDLKPGSFNLLEPDISHCMEADLTSIDLVIVPGLCFDLNFNRIGYGGGFYDRILKKLNSKINIIALAFDLQIFNNIPACSHDQKVDIIMTESNIYRDPTIDS
jgi:5-formyltetrahydrofolate cyclo-ligase